MFTRVIGIDGVPERLEQAKEHGASEVIDFTTGTDAVIKRVQDLT